VISSSDQQTVIALRVAANRIVVPPESRWMREPRSARGVWVIATLAVAFVGLVAVLVTLRGESRTVPGSVSHTIPPADSRAAVVDPLGPLTFDVSDDAGWLIARARAVPEFVVLKPTWLPRKPDSASQCDIETQFLFMDQNASEAYHVNYGQSHLFGAPCMLTFGGHLDPAWVAGLTDPSLPTVATFTARGTVVYVRKSGETVYLQWVENSAFYEIIANGYDLSDLVRALNSLEPMR